MQPSRKAERVLNFDASNRGFARCIHIGKPGVSRRVPSAGVFKLTGHPTDGRPGITMQTEKTQDFITIDRVRRFGTVFIRVAVGLLLGCAIAVALVATGLDLLPIRP
jgi:hypothetical protein